MICFNNIVYSIAVIKNQSASSEVPCEFSQVRIFFIVFSEIVNSQGQITPQKTKLYMCPREIYACRARSEMVDSQGRITPTKLLKFKCPREIYRTLSSMVNSHGQVTPTTKV